MAAFPGRSIALFDVTGDAAAHLALGETSLSFGEYRAAEAPLARAAEIAPGDARARVALAVSLAGQGRGAEAEAECKAAVALDPGAAEPGGICAALAAPGGLAGPRETTYLPPPRGER